MSKEIEGWSQLIGNGGVPLTVFGLVSLIWSRYAAMHETIEKQKQEKVVALLEEMQKRLDMQAIAIEKLSSALEKRDSESLEHYRSLDTSVKRIIDMCHVRDN